MALKTDQQSSDRPDAATRAGRATLRILPADFDEADLDEPVKISWSEAYRRLHEAIERRESHD